MTVLVIDIGTSSLRALLLDEQANLIPNALARRPHQLTTTSDGGAFFEVLPLQANLEACLDEILTHPAAQSIQAVGMDTFVGNVVGVDANQRPLTPLFTYAETRPKQVLETLRPFYNQEDTLQRTGCPHHTAYLPSQLAWFKAKEPELFSQVAQWLDLGTWLYRQWFGRAIPMSYSVASWSGLLNRQALTWDSRWLSHLELSADHFPTLADYNATQRSLQPLYQERWPSLSNVPFYLAVGDGAAANIGVGAVGAGQAALTLGTTGAVRIVTTASNPPVPEGLWAYRVDAGHHLLGGATSEGGNIYQWIQQTMQLPPDAEQQLAKRKLGEHGLTFIPALAGERSPSWNADATGSIANLRLSTSALDILQAALEGIAARLKIIFQALPVDGSVVIRASGGALSQSPVWAQLIADIFERPLELVETPEATARGTAMFILSDLHNRPLAEFPSSPSTLLLPRH